MLWFLILNFYLSAEDASARHVFSIQAKVFLEYEIVQSNLMSWLRSVWECASQAHTLHSAVE